MWRIKVMNLWLVLCSHLWQKGLHTTDCGKDVGRHSTFKNQTVDPSRYFCIVTHNITGLKKHNSHSSDITFRTAVLPCSGKEVLCQDPSGNNQDVLAVLEGKELSSECDLVTRKPLIFFCLILIQLGWLGKSMFFQSSCDDATTETGKFLLLSKQSFCPYSLKYKIVLE